MIDENKETHYYNMKVIKLMRWSIEKLCYLQLNGIYFHWKLLLMFMSLLGFRFTLSGLSGLSIHVYIKISCLLVHTYPPT